MNRKKKIIFIIICLLVFLVGIIAFRFLRDKDDTYSTEYTESGRENAVVYDGKSYQYNEHLSNYLFMGIDTRETVEGEHARAENGRADAIYLLSYDRVKKTVKSIAIPRDTIANIHVYAADGTDLGMTKDHINMQYLYGDGKTKSCQLMKESISTLLYGIPIQGYCALNMDGIPEAVKVLGGVNLIVPDKTLEKVHPKFKEGAEVTITEVDAEQFVRYRDTQQSQSAMDRMNRQKVFMEAFVDTAKKQAVNDAGLVVNLSNGVKPYMVTNMGTDLFAQLLEATYDNDNKITDIPGEKVDGMDFDEYHINETQLHELILQMFYQELQDN